MSETIFSETFFMFCITSGIGFILALAKALYKSKCKSCNICYGLIAVERDINNEEKLDELALQTHGTSSKDEKENSV